MTEITIKVNTNTFKRQLNELKLSDMTPTQIENHIRKNIQVSKVGSGGDMRFYVSLKGDDEND